VRITQELYKKRVEPVLKKQLGEELVHIYTPENISTSMEVLLKYTVKNYTLFDGCLPKYGKNMLNAISKKKIEKKEIEKILCIFGMEQPDWFRYTNI